MFNKKLSWTSKQKIKDFQLGIPEKIKVKVQVHDSVKTNLCDKVNVWVPFNKKTKLETLKNYIQSFLTSEQLKEINENLKFEEGEYLQQPDFSIDNTRLDT